MEDPLITAPAVERLSDVEPVDGLRVVHIQHPDFGKPPPFVALCGAEVIGVMAESAATCSHCLELRRQRRMRRDR